jgi:hypothetical protein
MKALFTLLICTGTLTSVFAQSNRQDAYPNQYRNEDVEYRTNDQPAYAAPNTTVIVEHRTDRDDYRYNDRRNDDYRYHLKMEREARIEKINWRYAAKINAVQNDPCLRFYEKDRIIRNLEFERAQQIKMVYAQYSNHGFDNHFDRDNDWRH